MNASDSVPRRKRPRRQKRIAAEAKAEAQRLIDAARAEGEAMMQKALAEAQSEAEALKQTAAANKDKAVNFIIKELV